MVGNLILHIALIGFCRCKDRLFSDSLQISHSGCKCLLSNRKKRCGALHIHQPPHPKERLRKYLVIIYVEPLREIRTASASFVQEYNEKRFLYFQLAYNIINIIHQICYLQGVFYGFEFVCQPLYFSCQIICTCPS